ncbi:GNAT family N-acetyltransferase [Microvirga thermotolerans]|uniref:GNAT family N-acetyltransferase n=1 Tax=Microvirga thermotolerans TaxID=2651334 RepID=A0A5P9JR38_9HYPH|nr:GNAT family N-acetyltransferase [Microvirga thermotolerans]QFU15107.1 GNAT family N-acetyltransferase [Microvirga thermotolerans]
MPPCPAELRTERLVLRRWREEDDGPFAAMNADPEVMRFYPRIRTREESIAEARGHDASFDADGFGLWAVELPGAASFIGYAGLRRVLRPMSFQPPIEIGWRLGRRWWGQGYATEAARAALSDFFARTDHGEVVSFTTRQNLRSQRVMQRLGMRRDEAGSFDHPALPEGHPLRPHVLYRLSRKEFSRVRSDGDLP